jgi:nicotinate-nucleotide--dimethylbenzimidazole phosphoribosyltransferase
MPLPTPRTPDDALAREARAHLARLVPVPGALGRLDELAGWWAATRGLTAVPPSRARLILFAADHGVTSHAWCPPPGEPTTAERLDAYVAGFAAGSVAAATAGVEVEGIDVGVRPAPGAGPQAGPATPRPATRVVRPVGPGTADFTEGPAMTVAQADEALHVGLDAAERAARDGVDVLALAELGVGNTASASAILAAATGMPARLTVGAGRGDDDVARKTAVVERALAHHALDRHDGMAILTAVGGFELAAIAGACAGAAAHGIPVLLDGFACTAGGLLAHLLDPRITPWMQVGPRSAENAHWAMARYLGREPLHDLGLSAGEGVGAVIGVSTLRTAAAMLQRAAGGVAGGGEPPAPSA